jgi:hypothetical protein
MHVKHEDIVAKYAPLIARLRDAGWRVRPFTKTSTLDPSDNERWPWEAPAGSGTQPGSFVMKPANHDTPQGFRMAFMYNKLVYNSARSKLATMKKPGPDGVYNEVLKHLPESFHEVLYRFFVQLWRLSRTPDSWKTALTVLPYKKGDPHNVQNYRPIGLRNVVYKIWTAMVTICMTTFIQEHDVLSDSQEGFRPKRNTVRQLQRLIMAIEDAKLSDNRRCGMRPQQMRATHIVIRLGVQVRPTRR